MFFKNNSLSNKVYMIAKNKVFVLDYHVYFEREKKETLNHKLSANH